MEFQGWQAFVHPLFEKQLEKLTRQVERLETRDPKGYAAHPATKILASVNYYLREGVPSRLEREQSCGNSPLGHWLEVRLHSRYRLFYRIAREQRIIIYAWISNDHDSRTGAFGAFRTMLETGDLRPLRKRP